MSVENTKTQTNTYIRICVNIYVPKCKHILDRELHKTWHGKHAANHLYIPCFTLVSKYETCNFAVGQ